MMKISRKLCKEILPLVEEVQRRCADLREYYAKERKDVFKKMNSLLVQICIHWCLIYCAKKYGIGAENLAHWGTEVRAFLNGFNDDKMKMGNDPRARLKMAAQVWNEIIGSPKNFKNLSGQVSEKMRSEGMTDKQIVQEVISAFINSERSIVQLMAMDAYNAERYINSLIGGDGNENQVSQQGRGGRKRR